MKRRNRTYERRQHPYQIRDPGYRVRSQNFVIRQFPTDCIVAKSKERDVWVFGVVALVFAIRISIPSCPKFAFSPPSPPLLSASFSFSLESSHFVVSIQSSINQADPIGRKPRHSPVQTIEKLPPQMDRAQNSTAQH